MASTVIYQSLSSAGQSLLPWTFRLMRCPTMHMMHPGHISRCLSAKLNNSVCAMRSVGYQDNRNASSIDTLPLLSAMTISRDLSDIQNDMTVKDEAETVPQKLTSLDFEVMLEQSLSRLTLSPLESRLNVDLMLPSVKWPNYHKIILDPSPVASMIRDCPTFMPLMPFYDPVSNPWIKDIRLPLKGNTIRKHASNILHKRRRKMNRHQYLKWKKRNKFKIRIQKQRSRKKKRLKWEQHLAKFRFTGLKPGEGEEYLAKKRENMAIFLHYLDIKTDEEIEAERKKFQPAAKVGKVVPEPMLPEGAKVGSNN